MARPQPRQAGVPGLWRIFQFFLPRLRRERGLIAGSFVGLFAEVILRLLEPWPLKFIFDRVITTSPGGGQSGIAAIDALDPVTLLTVSALGIIVITGLRALAAYYNTVGFALVGNRVLTAVRGDLFRHLQTLSLSFHSRARSGDLTIRVIGDVGLLKDVIVTAMLPLLGNTLILLGMLALMVWLNWQLTLLGLVTVPLFWFVTTRLSRRIQEVARVQRQREGALASTAAESIGAIKTVQALSLEEMFSRTFSGQNRQSMKDGVKAKRLEANLERTVDVLIAISTGLVLWFGASLVLRNELTPGDLLVFLTYLKNGFRPLRDFAKYTGRLAKATAAGERVLDMLERKPDVRDMPNSIAAPAFQGAVQFENVSFAYEPDERVLSEVEFTVEPGQYVALVAPSGSGKSTITSLLLRLYDPQSGRVLIDGQDIRGYTLASLRSQIGVVLQDTLLFAASIRDNIAYGAPDATIEDVVAAAELANIHEFVTSLPDGYDTILGERGVTVSSGQRQRIAIARAAIRRAPLLILDEPTTGLDEENEQAVMEALERLAVGRTTFLITHDLCFAARADVIFYLDNGRVRERGTHAELMQASAGYAALFTLQNTTVNIGDNGRRSHALAR